MNWKTWVPLILAMVLGVVAAKVARDAISKNQSAVAPSGKTTKVVVAKSDIQPGKELSDADVTTAEMEADRVPAGAFRDPSALNGRVCETLTVKNQPILEQMLAPTGTGSGLQALVPAGMRAITMEVNEFSGVAGLIAPGCRVDIIATINGGDANGQIAKTIVQNVKVTAIGQKTTIGNDAPPSPNEMFKSVTVLASLGDAEAIELACSTGRPRLVLRGGRDNTVVATAGISIGELRAGGSGSTAMVPVTPPQTQPVVVITPTTRPHDAVVRSDTRRKVKVIRAGQESTVFLNVMEGPANDTVTDTKDPFYN